MNSPVAFLCHASEDKETVRDLARGLMANGVRVFLDEWEIGPGDSIRQKIDAGLGECTHFVAVLSPTSLLKPWVNLEMDGGLVLRLSGLAKFIPLRLGLEVDSLPPLFRGLHSPEVGDPDAAAVTLANFIHGVSQKPALGAIPTPVREASSRLRMSPSAQALARKLVDQSLRGRVGDPQLSPQDIMMGCELGMEDMIDAVDEIEATGMILVTRGIGAGARPFICVSPERGFFSAFDGFFGVNNPASDARSVAVHMINNGLEATSTAVLAKTLGWTPRRMNPALEYLSLNNLIQTSAGIDQDWSPSSFRTIPATRRFARGQ